MPTRRWKRWSRSVLILAAAVAVAVLVTVGLTVFTLPNGWFADDAGGWAVRDQSFSTVFAPTAVLPGFQPRAITEFPVSPDELVIGVEVGGRARAYPVNMLTGPDREILNYEVGGTALAATCATTASCMPARSTGGS